MTPQRRESRTSRCRRAFRRRWHRVWWPSVDPDEFDESSVVVAHEWLTSGGSDKVAGEIARTTEAQAVICLSSLPAIVDDLGVDVIVHQCRLGRWASAGRRWQLLLPLMPMIWGSLDLGRTGRLITSSHSLVNSIRPGARRICYCHTPVRYGWEWRMERGRLPVPLRPLLGPAAAILRRWDRHISRRVDVFVANSSFVAERIEQAYGRTSVVIHPPIDIGRFVLSEEERTDEYLVAGRMIPYKRADLAVAAANAAGVPLVVAGHGPDWDRLVATAGPTVRFVESPSNDELVELMQRSRALLHPGIEDFGMIVVEAQACGTPVIARAEGGALDSTDLRCSGLLLDSDRVAVWAQALRTFEDPGSPAERRAWAETFSVAVFHRRFAELLDCG